MVIFITARLTQSRLTEHICRQTKKKKAGKKKRENRWEGGGEFEQLVEMQFG